MTFLAELGAFLWERRVWWLTALFLLLLASTVTALVAVDRCATFHI